MRIFIAIDLDDDTKKRLGELQDRMRRLNIGGNYSPRENLHITLAFIGETNDPEAVFDVVEGIKFRPLDITVDGMGIDPDMEPVVTEARSFSVMKSTRGRYHMIYEELCSVPASDTGR